MTVLETFWLIFLFLLCLFAYLGFSLIAQQAVVFLMNSLDPKKETYLLPPLSRLYPHTEELIAILNFSRLLFFIPLLLLAYKQTSQFSAWAVTATMIGLTLLLYLLPQWLLQREELSVFRGGVQTFAYLLYPLFWLLSQMSPDRLPGQPPQQESGSGAEPQAEETEFKGDILKAVSEIGETTVREVMTPRVDMVSISASATLDELHSMFKEHKFSRLPVYKEKVDNIVGIVSVMDLVSQMPKCGSTTPVTTLMRPAMFVPETKKVYTLLREFRETRAQMAIIIDEYGGTSGLVTLEDLLEEIVGEIGDERDEKPDDFIRDKDGTLIVTGKFPIEKLEEIFGIEVAGEDFETISGLIFSILGRIPLVGEVVRYKYLHMEILEADKRRIHRVRIRELPREHQEEEDAREAI